MNAKENVYTYVNIEHDQSTCEQKSEEIYNYLFDTAVTLIMTKYTIHNAHTQTMFQAH
jgi:hypothetical protein